MNYLKQSTAAQTRIIGPFVDSTDGVTLEDALTIANTDIKLCINGAAAVDKNSGGGTSRSNGLYAVTFDATDTATVGEITVSVAVAGALVVVHKFIVLEEAVFAALFEAAAPGFATVAALATAQTGISAVVKSGEEFTASGPNDANKVVTFTRN